MCGRFTYIFTIEEANKLIPKLSDIIQELHIKRQAIMGLEVEIDALELVADKDKDGASPLVGSKIDD